MGRETDLSILLGDMFVIPRAVEYIIIDSKVMNCSDSDVKSSISLGVRNQWICRDEAHDEKNDKRIAFAYKLTKFGRDHMCAVNWRYKKYSESLNNTV